MALKQNDFVKVTFTAKLKEDGRVFDTTDENVAKENDLGGKGPFGPQTICLGQGFMLEGLEKKLVGKEKGKHTIELSPEFVNNSSRTTFVLKHASRASPESVQNDSRKARISVSAARRAGNTLIRVPIIWAHYIRQILQEVTCAEQ